MEYQYVLQSLKSKKFWSNNAGWTKKLINANLWEREGDVICDPGFRLVKVKVITKIVRA